jgi:hypothetical protein
VPIPITVAVVGDPSDPLAPPWEDFFEREWKRPYRERPTLDLVVQEDETLGEVMNRAAAELGVDVPDGWAGPVAFIAFYKPEDEQEGLHSWTSTITLVDDSGRAVWNNYWKDVQYRALLRAADAGALDGDPRRPYLILHAEIGNGLLADWHTLVNLWDLAWYAIERVGIAYAAYEAAVRAAQGLRNRIHRGREVVRQHHSEWQERGGDPSALAAFLAQRPMTTDEVARFLGCTNAEGEAVLWAFGLAPDESGRWRPRATDEAKMLAQVFELIVQGYSHFELEREFRQTVEHFVKTGEVRPIDWGRPSESDTETN